MNPTQIKSIITLFTIQNINQKFKLISVKEIQTLLIFVIYVQYYADFEKYYTNLKNEYMRSYSLS